MPREITYQDKLWLSNYEKGVAGKLVYETTCIPDYLERATAKFPKNTALIFSGLRISYSELNNMVNRLATSFHKFGIKKGDSVAIVLPNTIQCVVSYYAILRLGGIVVFNNPLYSDRELIYQLNDSDAKAVITLDLLANRLIDMRKQTKLQRIIYATLGEFLPITKKVLFRIAGKRKKLTADVKPADEVYNFKDLIMKYKSNPPTVKLSFDDVAMYQYTGGTTGISKGVILTHANLSKQVQQIAAWFPSFRQGGERMLGALPFFHVFGMTTSMNLAVYMGWSNVLIPKPNPADLLEAIRNFKPTFAPLVPTMYIGMLNHADLSKTDMTSIKGCFSGSAPLALEVIRDFEEVTGSIIVEGYGLTETTPVTHINPFAGGERKVGSIGLPVPDTECRIVSLDDGQTDLPVGESGEVLIKGPQVMKGYKNKPKETSVALDNGWLHTGDIGKMDEEGYFYIVDRKKDMIISGGYNVYPREVEEVFFEHPKVREVAAVGVPHPHRGEAVKLFVVLKEKQTATTDELMEYAHSELAKFKWPVEIEFMEELPKTNVGKILKKDLKERESKVNK